MNSFIRHMLKNRSSNESSLELEDKTIVSPASKKTRSSNHRREAEDGAIPSPMLKRTRSSSRPKDGESSHSPRRSKRKRTLHWPFTSLDFFLKDKQPFKPFQNHKVTPSESTVEKRRRGRPAKPKETGKQKLYPLQPPTVKKKREAFIKSAQKLKKTNLAKPKKTDKQKRTRGSRSNFMETGQHKLNPVQPQAVKKGSAQKVKKTKKENLSKPQKTDRQKRSRARGSKLKETDRQKLNLMESKTVKKKNSLIKSAQKVKKTDQKPSTSETVKKREDAFQKSVQKEKSAKPKKDRQGKPKAMKKGKNVEEKNSKEQSTSNDKQPANKRALEVQKKLESIQKSRRRVPRKPTFDKEDLEKEGQALEVYLNSDSDLNSGGNVRKFYKALHELRRTSISEVDTSEPEIGDSLEDQTLRERLELLKKGETGESGRLLKAPQKQMKRAEPVEEVCSWCDSYIEVDKMKAHVKAQHKKRCFVQGCRAWFDTQELLDQHRRDTHMEKLHICVLCEKYLLSAKALERHLKSVIHKRFERVFHLVLNLISGASSQTQVPDLLAKLTVQPATSTDNPSVTDTVSPYDKKIVSVSEVDGLQGVALNIQDDIPLSEATDDGAIQDFLNTLREIDFSAPPMDMDLNPLPSPPMSSTDVEFDPWFLLEV